MQGPQTVHHHVLYRGTVDAGNGDGTAIGVADGDIGEAEVAELAPCHGAELDAVGRRAARAVLYHHILADAVHAVALKAERIVRRIHNAVAYDHIAAVHYVHPVVVPVCLAIHGLVFNQQMAALVVLLVPAGGIAQGDAADGDILALAEMDILRSVGFARSVILQRVLHQPHVDVFHQLVGHFPAASVYGASTGDGNVVLPHGKEQGRPPAVRVLHVVEGIERPQQCGPFVQVQRHATFQI